MILVVDETEVEKVRTSLKNHGESSVIIGKIEKSNADAKETERVRGLGQLVMPAL